MRGTQTTEATETTTDTVDEQLPEERDVVVSAGVAQTGGLPAGGAVDRIIPDRTVSNVTPEDLEKGLRNPDVDASQTGEVSRG
jgi:hypothetical protein